PAFQQLDLQIRELFRDRLLELLELGNGDELVEDAEAAGNEIGPAGREEELGREDADLLDQLLQLALEEIARGRRPVDVHEALRIFRRSAAHQREDVEPTDIVPDPARDG